MTQTHNLHHKEIWLPHSV